MGGTIWIKHWIIIAQVLTISAFDRNQNGLCALNNKIDLKQGVSINSIGRICLPRCSTVTESKRIRNSDTADKLLYIGPDRISNKTVQVHWINTFPKCREYVTLSEYVIIDRIFVSFAEFILNVV